MFELRWLKKETFTDEFDGSINIRAKVLQFRTTVMSAQINPISILPGGDMMTIDWTDWQDVPIQMEEEDGRK